MSKSTDKLIEKTQKRVADTLCTLSYSTQTKTMGHIIVCLEQMFKDMYKVTDKMSPEEIEDFSYIVHDRTGGCFYNLEDFETDVWCGEKYGDFETSFDNAVSIYREICY